MDHLHQSKASGLGSDIGFTNTTKTKLAVLSERICGFERQMETEAKQRRESEEGRVIAIKEAISKLEKTLNAEIKRRVEANKALQAVSSFLSLSFSLCACGSGSLPLPFSLSCSLSLYCRRIWHSATCRFDSTIAAFGIHYISVPAVSPYHMLLSYQCM